MMDPAVRAWFRLAEIAPVLALGLAALLYGSRTREDWFIAAVFATSFAADLANLTFGYAGWPNWVVMAVYPIPQVAVLAYGLVTRWPQIQHRLVLVSVSLPSVAAAVILIRETLPARPEMGTLAVASVVACWIVSTRPDIGRWRSWSLYLAFGATLPAVVVMGRAFEAGRFVEALWVYKTAFTLGILVYCVGVLWPRRKLVAAPIAVMPDLGRN